jgi:hypothetical protein
LGKIVLFLNIENRIGKLASRDNFSPSNVILKGGDDGSDSFQVGGGDYPSKEDMPDYMVNR